MVKKTKIHLTGEPDAYINSLINSGTPHKITYTNNSTKIETSEKSYSFTSLELTPFELAFIGMAKNDVKNNAEKLGLKTCSPKFFNLYDFPEGFYNVVEIDINSAFWETAYKIGLLSKRIYETGRSVSKDARLVAFGAAATVKRVFEFDGENYVSCSESSCKWGRAAYFRVAKIVTDDLREICEEIPGRAFGWWVDAIFVDSLYSDYTKKSLFQKGYTFKEKIIKDAQFSKTGAGERIWRLVEASGREKFLRQKKRINTEKNIYELLK